MQEYTVINTADTTVEAVDLLTQVDELASELDHPDLVIVDCRFDLLRPDAGRAAWEKGHIPGAFYAHLDEDLAGAVDGKSGRHPLPDPDDFAALIGSWGVGPDKHVVAYDASGGAIAARLWWLLRWVGHPYVSLLDGGFPAWEAQKLPISQDHPAKVWGKYPVEPNSMPVVTTEEIAANLQSGAFTLLDARDKERYAGHVEPIDSRAGHIPGALNRPFNTNLDARGKFRSSADLAESFRALAHNSSGQLVSMCGSGVTACQNLFALELAGIDFEDSPKPALYAGSWSEWIRSAARPIENLAKSLN